MVLAFALTVVLSLVVTTFFGTGFKTMNTITTGTKYGFVAVVSGVIGLIVGLFVDAAFACAGMGVLTSLVTMGRIMRR